MRSKRVSKKQSPVAQELRAIFAGLSLAVQKFTFDLCEREQAELYPETFIYDKRLTAANLAILKAHAAQIVRERKNRMLEQLTKQKNVLAWLGTEQSGQELNSLCNQLIIRCAEGSTNLKIPLKCCACEEKYPHYGFAPAFRYKPYLFILLCKKCYDLYDPDKKTSGSYVVTPAPAVPLTEFDFLREEDHRKYVDLTAVIKAYNASVAASGGITVDAYQVPTGSNAPSTTHSRSKIARRLA